MIWLSFVLLIGTYPSSSGRKASLRLRAVGEHLAPRTQSASPSEVGTSR
jgi:hypothetical protein